MNDHTQREFEASRPDIGAAQEQPDYSDLTAVLKEIAQGLSDVADAMRASEGMGKAIDATLHEWDAF